MVCWHPQFIPLDSRMIIHTIFYVHFHFSHEFHDKKLLELNQYHHLQILLHDHIQDSINSCLHPKYVTAGWCLLYPSHYIAWLSFTNFIECSLYISLSIFLVKLSMPFSSDCTKNYLNWSNHNIFSDIMVFHINILYPQTFFCIVPHEGCSHIVTMNYDWLLSLQS